MTVAGFCKNDGSGYGHDDRAWELRTRRSCLVVVDTADTTVLSAVSATTRHDHLFYLPTNDLAPFSIHIPTKNPLTLINDFVVDS